MSRRTKMLRLDDACLRHHHLPPASEAADKDARGQVFAIGGSDETPGAILLAAVASLRAGAGKLKIATVAAHLSTMAIAVPEALVAPLSEAEEYCRRADAVGYGPGMDSEDGEMLGRLRRLRSIAPAAIFVVDSEALVKLSDEPPLLTEPCRLVLTPHAGEMAKLVGKTREQIESDPSHWARYAAKRWHAVVALKGADTVVTSPEGEVFQHRFGTVGLATSGSGDTLAGIIGGLAARGATALAATLWGVRLHALAGQSLLRRYGGIGFLAREIPGEIPRLLSRLEGKQHRRSR